MANNKSVSESSIFPNERELFKRLKEENAKLVKWWERLPEEAAGFERKGTYNPLTGEVE